MLAAAVPTTFQDVQEADDVGIGVGVRIEQRMADAGLGSEVDDGLETVGGKQFRNRITIGEIVLREKKARVPGELGQPSSFQIRVVIGIEVVERDNRAAVGEQASRDVKADEASRPSDKNRLHRASPSPL